MNSENISSVFHQRWPTDPSPELTLGQWVMWHRSNGSTDLDGSHGSWVTKYDPLSALPFPDKPLGHNSFLYYRIRGSVK